MWKNVIILRPDVSLLIYPSAIELYYTMSLQTSWYRAPLHQVGLTCGWMQTYWGQMYSCPINPSATEPYYTMSVWHVAECGHTQVRCTPPPLLTLVVQKPSTPCQFEMWKNADIPRSDVPTPPSWTLVIEPYHTMSVWHVGQCRHTLFRCTPTPTNWP